MITIYLTPAYGRKYESIDSMLEDWNKNKDFKMFYSTSVTYANKEDLKILKDSFNIKQVIFQCGEISKVFDIKHLI